MALTKETGRGVHSRFVLPLRMQAAGNGSRSQRQALWLRAFRKIDIWRRACRLGAVFGAVYFLVTLANSDNHAGFDRGLVLRLILYPMAVMLAAALSAAATDVHRAAEHGTPSPRGRFAVRRSGAAPFESHDMN